MEARTAHRGLPALHTLRRAILSVAPTFSFRATLNMTGNSNWPASPFTPEACGCDEEHCSVNRPSKSSGMATISRTSPTVQRSKGARK